MRTLLLIVVCMIALAQPCYALDTMHSIYPDDEIQLAKDKLPEAAYDIVNDYNILNGEGINETISHLKSYIKNSVINAICNIWNPMISVFGVIVICSVLEPLFSSNGHTLPIHLFGAVEILVLTLSDAKAFFQEGIEAVHTLYDFSTVLLPCLASLSVAAGATMSAGVKYTAAALFMNLLLNCANTILVPVVSAYLVAMIGNTVFEQRILGVVSDGIRWGSKTALTWTTIGFTAYLNISGLITSTGDLFATRITKTALSTALPVVGSIISGAASSLVAGASILRNSVGVFGLLSVIGILLIPLINLGVRYFSFVLIARLSSLFPNRRYSDLINGIAGAYGMLLGLIGTGFVMIFLTLISFMQIVGA